MNILCVGDIVGKPGRIALEKCLPELKEKYKIDFVIVNAENAAGGSGLTTKLAKQFIGEGCDVLTLGDHVWDQKEIESFLEETTQVIRPANFPEGAPGKGWCIQPTKKGLNVGVVNLLGRTFMRYPVECPFKQLKGIVQEIKKYTPIVVVDFHAEATSEKVALGHFIDGDVSIVFGTHTHIQTADDTILDKGTAYITDVGMSGPYDSVIGQAKENIIQKFLTSRPIKFQVAENKIKLCGIVVSVDDSSGKAKSIKRIQMPIQVTA
ncbi:MAG: TIGR00282 family metallophosphoesterase [Candidatus Omnitrophota bacterium]